MSFLRAFLRVVLSFLTVAALAEAVAAQTHTVSETRRIGSGSIGVSRDIIETGVTTPTTASGSAEATLQGNFLGVHANLGTNRFVSRHNNAGNRITSRIGNSTVFDVAAANNVLYAIPITYRTLLSASATVFTFGPVRIRLRGSLGAGTQFTGVVRTRASRPVASISAAAQVFGNAEGAVTGDILGGIVGSLRVTASLDYLNTTTGFTLNAVSGNGLPSTQVDIQTLQWELKLKLKVTTLHGLLTLWSQTLADWNGPTTSVTLL